MATATRQMRDRVERIMKEGLACDCCSAEIKVLFNEWIANRENTLKTKEVADKLIPLMEKCGCDICKQFLELRHSLVKKSQWIFGGDGWGYDIGFGGLDHVLASGEDVSRRPRTPLNKSNIVSNVVVDTEVYSCYGCEHLIIKSNGVSNTGGQSSNEQNFQWMFCPAGAVAKLPPQGRQPQHATSGKKIRKKDLGMIAKSYGYVYVAQGAMGASQAQYFSRIPRTPLNKSNEVSNVIKEALFSVPFGHYRKSSGLSSHTMARRSSIAFIRKVETFRGSAHRSTGPARMLRPCNQPKLNERNHYTLSCFK